MAKNMEKFAYLISGVLGIAVWLMTSWLTNEPEAWDSRHYFVYGLPLMMLVAGLLGFAAPARPWRWGLIMLGGQGVVAVIQHPTANLLPLGLVMFALLSIPCLATAAVGSFLRRKVDRRVAG